MISDTPAPHADVVASSELLAEVMTESNAPPAQPEEQKKEGGCPWLLLIVVLVGVLAAALYFFPAIRPKFLRPVQTEVEGLDVPKTSSETKPESVKASSPAEEVLARKEQTPNPTENRLVPMADFKKAEEQVKQPIADADPTPAQISQPADKPAEGTTILGFTVPPMISNMMPSKIAVPQFVKDLGNKVPVPGVVKSAYNSATAKYGSTYTIGGIAGGTTLLGALAYYYVGTKVLVLGGLGAAAYYGWKNGWLNKIPGLSSIPMLSKFTGTSVAGPSPVDQDPTLRKAQF